MRSRCIGAMVAYRWYECYHYTLTNCRTMHHCALWHPRLRRIAPMVTEALEGVKRAIVVFVRLCGLSNPQGDGSEIAPRWPGG